MAIQAIIIGAIKRSLKPVFKKVLGANKAYDITSKDAIILNRLKTKQDKTLKEYIAKEYNIPLKDVNNILKHFNQTKKMKDISKGTTFKHSLRSVLKGEIDIKYGSTIKESIKLIGEYSKTGVNNFNNAVLNKLKVIEKELRLKVIGFSGAFNNTGNKILFNTDIVKYFNINKDYNVGNLHALDKILINLSLDLERYNQDSGDIVLVEDSKGWSRYNKSSIVNFIKEIKSDVIVSLK